MAIEDTVLIYPKGSGSTVAPYVLMGLIYTGKGPKAVVNRDICPSPSRLFLLGLPYGHGFDDDPCMAVNTGIRWNSPAPMPASNSVVERAQA